jgi:uncharacterized protein (DUF952 family)
LLRFTARLGLPARPCDARRCGWRSSTTPPFTKSVGPTNGQRRSAGVFRGSPDDRRDGFIHFSTAAQVRGTLEKYFAGESGLVLIAVAAGKLGAALKWEPSRGGALFPHLYGDLSLTAVLWSRPLASITDFKQLAQ